MPLQASRVNVGAVDTLIALPARNQRASVMLMHNGSASVFIGGPGVTLAQGFELVPGVPLTLEIDVDDEVHGIVAAGVISVSLLRID